MTESTIRLQTLSKLSHRGLDPRRLKDETRKPHTRSRTAGHAQPGHHHEPHTVKSTRRLLSYLRAIA